MDKHPNFTCSTLAGVRGDIMTLMSPAEFPQGPHNSPGGSCNSTDEAAEARGLQWLIPGHTALAAGL